MKDKDIECESNAMKWLKISLLVLSLNCNAAVALRLAKLVSSTVQIDADLESHPSYI